MKEPHPEPVGPVAGGAPSAALPSLTICMVAHDEAAIIAASLGSVVGWAGEIIVLDCESSDGTGDIARRMGARVEWHQNLIPEITKNVAFDLATTEWIFLLDADEIVPLALKEEVERTVRANPVENGFKIPRRNFYFGTPLLRGGVYPDSQLRLLRRGRGRFPGQGIHERIVIDGKIGALQNPFDHHPYPTFDAWKKKFDFYTRCEAERLAERRAELTPSAIRRGMIYRPLRRWIERLFIKRGIRDGVPGILAATFDLMTIVVGYGRYWMGNHAGGIVTRGEDDNPSDAQAH